MQQGAWGVSCRFGMREICIAIGQLTALPLQLCPLFPQWLQAITLFGLEPRVRQLQLAFNRRVVGCVTAGTHTHRHTHTHIDTRNRTWTVDDVGKYAVRHM